MDRFIKFGKVYKLMSHVSKPVKKNVNYIYEIHAKDAPLPKLHPLSMWLMSTGGKLNEWANYSAHVQTDFQKLIL